MYQTHNLFRDPLLVHRRSSSADVVRDPHHWIRTMYLAFLFFVGEQVSALGGSVKRCIVCFLLTILFEPRCDKMYI